MRSMGAWFGHLAMAGVCLLWVGCGGGSDVPDPASDSRAATSEAPRTINRPAPEPVAVASNDAPKSEPAESEKPAPEPPKEAPKADSSGTDEMLKTPAPQGSSPAPAPSPTPSPAPSTPTPAPTPAPTPGGPGVTPSPRAITPGGPPGNNAPGDADSTPPRGGTAPRGGQQINPVPPVGPNAPGRRPPGGGGPDGGGGGAGGGGGGGNSSKGFGLADESGGGAPGGPRGMGLGQNGADGPTNFRTPAGAVNAFLAALKSKNKDKLTEATARRAPTESVEKHRKLFSEIVDGSISDDDLDEISKSFDGFKVSYTLDAKSMGRIGVVVMKMTTGGGHLQRTVVARKEKDGWKVLDVEDLYDFKAMPSYNSTGRGRPKK